jgi:hypothetical protein
MRFHENSFRPIIRLLNDVLSKHCQVDQNMIH